jgi:hypothetical protein
MADKFSTTPNNFAKNTKDKSPTKYLDLAGLIVFFDKLREYIEDSDKKLNGSNIKMYAGQLGENNPTITGQIESLWAFLGEGELEGGIAANVAAILGQYVKHMKTPSTQNLPLKLNITEGADDGDEKDIYTISLVDNGLNDHIEDFDANRVKSLTPANSGGSVSLSVNKNKGDVTITINSQELTDKVADLEGGRIKSVSEGTSVENFVDLGISTTNNAVTITINDENLANEIDDIWTSVKNRVQDVNFTNTNTGTKYVTVSCTDDTNASAEGKQTNLTIDDTAVTEKFASVDSALKDRVQDVNFTNTNTGTKYVTVSCTDDSDSNNANGKQTNLTIDDTAVAEALADRVQDVNAENANTGTKYVTISCTDDTNTSAVGKQTKITIDDSALATKLSDHTTAIADRVQDVNAENTNTGTKYVTISCTDDTNTGAAGKQTKITIDDTAVTEKFASVDSTLKNRVQDVNFTNTNTGTKYVTVSCTDDSDSNNANGKQTNLTIDDTAVAEALADRVQDINFTNTNTGTKYVTVSCTDDSNSTTVGKQTNLTINDTAVAEALADRVQDVNVENANTGTKYVTISCTDDTNSTTVGKQTKITINDSNLTAAIEDIRSIISGMGQVVEIKGVLTSLPSTTDGYGNGDVVIVGNEEYICYESKWYLFGHTSELAEDYNAHTHSYTPEGTVSSSFTGTKATLTSNAP